MLKRDCPRSAVVFPAPLRLTAATAALDRLQLEEASGGAAGSQLGAAAEASLAELRHLLTLGGAQAEREATEARGAVSAWQQLQQLCCEAATTANTSSPPPPPPPPPPPGSGSSSQHQVDMDGLQARILSMEELLSARGAECERLQRQVLQLRRDLQAVDILKAQVDVYQQDFHQERRQRATLADECDQLRRELQQLQTRHRQLQQQGAERPQQLMSPQLPAVEAKKPETAERQLTVYSCPKCGMAFEDVVPLQNHANRCLDEE